MSIFYVPNNALDAWDASMNKPDASMNKPEPCGGAWERPPTAMCEPQGPHVHTLSDCVTVGQRPQQDRQG